MKVVRDSKFRHVFGEASKQKYEDLRYSTKATEAPGIRASRKFWAVPWQSGGGGTLAVIPNSKYGRLPHDIPLITGHQGAILDFEFSPFVDNHLCTASEDSTVKLWSIPDEGLKENLREPLCSLQGHDKKVSFSTFNTVASNIIASTSYDLTVRIWNLQDQQECFKVDIPEQVFSIKWNYTGNLLLVTTKDKRARIIDPRQKAIASENKIHEGVKASKSCWVGGPKSPEDCAKIITTGFSQQAERQIGVWDMRTFSSGVDKDEDPLNMLILDQGTGALYPHYDEGSKMFFIAGKGDSNIRYFEFVEGDPWLHFINNFSNNIPQKGVEFLPKRCVDSGKHEIARCLKVEATAVIPISFKVPRKIEQFQADLFPDCPAGVPTLDADAWCAGDEGCEPLLMSMDPAKAGQKVGGGAAAAPAFVSVKDLKAQLAEANAKIEKLEAENTALKEEIAKIKG